MITKDMIIGDIIAINPDLAGLLMSCGMHCAMCPSARGETLEEACFVHGMDVEEVTTLLNVYLEDHGPVNA